MFWNWKTLVVVLRVGVTLSIFEEDNLQHFIYECSSTSVDIQNSQLAMLLEFTSRCLQFLLPRFITFLNIFLLHNIPRRFTFS